jgi:hypothetical protein
MQCGLQCWHETSASAQQSTAPPHPSPAATAAIKSLSLSLCTCLSLTWHKSSHPAGIPAGDLSSITHWPAGNLTQSPSSQTPYCQYLPFITIIVTKQAVWVAVLSTACCFTQPAADIRVYNSSTSFKELHCASSSPCSTQLHSCNCQRQQLLHYVCAPAPQSSTGYPAATAVSAAPASCRSSLKSLLERQIDPAGLSSCSVEANPTSPACERLLLLLLLLSQLHHSRLQELAALPSSTIETVTASLACQRLLLCSRNCCTCYIPLRLQEPAAHQ